VQIADFKIERYFAQWEFAVPYVLGASDVEGYRLSDLLALADDDGRRLWDALTLGYTESPGHPKLRAEIAGLYEQIAADQVIVSNPVEAIFLFAHAILQPGDHVIVVWPAYQALYEAARSAKAEVTLLPLSADNGWQLSIDDLRAALRPNTRAIVINSPHNPTGAVIDRATFAAVVGLAREAGAWLFSDEMYRFLETGQASPEAKPHTHDRLYAMYCADHKKKLPDARRADGFYLRGSVQRRKQESFSSPGGIATGG